MRGSLSIGCEKIDVEYWMNASLCGKFEAIVDKGHHLDNLKGAMSSGHKLHGWLVGM